MSRCGRRDRSDIRRCPRHNGNPPSQADMSRCTHCLYPDKWIACRDRDCWHTRLYSLRSWYLQQWLAVLLYKATGHNIVDSYMPLYITFSSWVGAGLNMRGFEIFAIWKRWRGRPFCYTHSSWLFHLTACLYWQLQQQYQFPVQRSNCELNMFPFIRNIWEFV